MGFSGMHKDECVVVRIPVSSRSERFCTNFSTGFSTKFAEKLGNGSPMWLTNVGNAIIPFFSQIPFSAVLFRLGRR